MASAMCRFVRAWVVVLGRRPLSCYVWWLRSVVRGPSRFPIHGIGDRVGEPGCTLTRLAFVWPNGVGLFRGHFECRDLSTPQPCNTT